MVTKIPRFAFEKFPQANDRLTTQMKSVGEVMAMGRSIQESMQKALRGMETGLSGLDERSTDRETIVRELGEPGPERLLYVADAFRIGMSAREIFEVCKIDPWFLAQLQDLVAEEAAVKGQSLDALDADTLRRLKRKGFSDRRLAALLGVDQGAVRNKALGRRHPPGVQARGHLRGRVLHQHRLYVLDLRRRVRGATVQPPENHGAGRRAEPHRPGH